ncbi:MAG: hypothetical protein ACFFD2_00735 [Promethearchaeota archaeon]
MVLWDQAAYWIQWISTFALFSLIALAGIMYILHSKRLTLDGTILSGVLFIIILILEKLGIQILLPEIYNFLERIF